MPTMPLQRNFSAEINAGIITGGHIHAAFDPLRSAMTCSLAAGNESGSVDCRHKLSMISCRWVASPNSDISPSWRTHIGQHSSWES